MSHFFTGAGLLLAGLTCTVRPQLDGDVLTSPSLTPDAGCTPRSQANEFPVKVLMLVENSGRMCVIDPPGSTGAPGFCEALPFDGGVKVPGRISVIQQFLADNAARPNLQVAVLPYALVPGQASFQAVDAPALQDGLAALPGQLGKADDLQSGLEAARALLELDMAAATPALRARSRYVVVLITTGLPTPRCAANDTRTVWASETMPDGVWRDQTSICNDGCAADAGCPADFMAGGDRNQIAQLIDQVDQLMALKDSQGLGDIRVHTRLVMNEDNLMACGPTCAELFSPVTIPYARSVGQYTLQLLAQRGQGTYAAPLTPQGLSLSSDGGAAVVTTEFTQLCSQ